MISSSLFSLAASLLRASSSSRSCIWVNRALCESMRWRGDAISTVRCENSELHGLLAHRNAERRRSTGRTALAIARSTVLLESPQCSMLEGKCVTPEVA